MPVPFPTQVARKISPSGESTATGTVSRGASSSRAVSDPPLELSDATRRALAFTILLGSPR
jgi:hypothetical protein